LSRLLSSRQKREEFGARAKEAVAGQEFTFNNMCRDTQALYADLLTKEG
jgi:hypothetical protein